MRRFSLGCLRQRCDRPFFAVEFIRQRLNVSQCRSQVADDSRCDIFGRGEALFRIGLCVPQPRDVEVVVARRHLLAREAAEPPSLALVRAL